MKRWYVIVVTLYGLLLIAVIFPLMKLALQPLNEILSGNIIESLKEDIKFFTESSLWIWFIVILMAQAAFLAVPVDIAAKRPVKKRKSIFTIIAASFMMGLLVIGATVSIIELIAHDAAPPQSWLISMGALLLSWLIWGFVFYQWSKKNTPESLIKKLCRWLLRGSILELLIVVPTHIIVRHRDYCCAGFGTFTGITCGIAVMFFAFGPSIFFLYARQWQTLHQNGAHPD